MSNEKAAEFDFFTRQDVNVVVKNSFGPAFKLIDYAVTNYSERILGFMGAHRTLSVKVRKENSAKEETRNYFVKCLPAGDEVRSNWLEEVDFYYKESSFYKHILPELTSSIKDDSWCPRCYLTKDNMIVLEDLATRNYILKVRLLDIESLGRVLVAMAKLHGSSVLAEKRLGKTFLELHPKALAERVFLQAGFTGQWYRTGVDVVVAIAKKLGLDTTLIPAVCVRIFDAVSTSKTRQNVIGHGDAWSYNFMFDESPLAPNCIMMDFQMIRYAPAMVDVSQFFYYTMRREVREKNEQQLLRHYYDAFAKILKTDKEIAVPSFSQILKEFEIYRVVGIVSAVLQLPVSMVDGELGASLLSNQGGFTKLILGERTDLILDFMSKDSLYNDRLVEVVTELVERSNQLCEGIGE